VSAYTKLAITYAEIRRAALILRDFGIVGAFFSGLGPVRISGLASITAALMGFGIGGERRCKS
jgi:hypothetical protein